MKSKRFQYPAIFLFSVIIFIGSDVCMTSEEIPPPEPRYEMHWDFVSEKNLFFSVGGVVNEVYYPSSFVRNATFVQLLRRGEYQGSFFGVSSPNGNLQVFPYFPAYDFFKIKGKLYFWGCWNYPETCWLVYRVHKFDDGKVVEVFSESAF